MPTILTDDAEIEVASMRAPPGLWMNAADFARVAGYEVKPEGMCKGAVCVPVPRGSTRYVDDAGNIDAAAFWRHIGNVAVSDAAGKTWAFGAGAGERAQALETLAAPDFVLPDFDGKRRRLSDYRGQKIFLATWASW